MAPGCPGLGLSPDLGPPLSLQRAPVRNGRGQRSSSGLNPPPPGGGEAGGRPLGQGPILHLGGSSPPKIKFLWWYPFSFQSPHLLEPRGSTGHWSCSQSPMAAELERPVPLWGQVTLQDPDRTAARLVGGYVAAHCMVWDPRTAHQQGGMVRPQAGGHLGGHSHVWLRLPAPQGKAAQTPRPVEGPCGARGFPQLNPDVQNKQWSLASGLVSVQFLGCG